MSVGEPQQSFDKIKISGHLQLSRSEYRSKSVFCECHSHFDELCRQFRAKKRILCDHCRGSGAASDGDIHTCSACGGSGVRLVKQQVKTVFSYFLRHDNHPCQIFPGMVAQSQVTCSDCGGRGKVIKKQCPHCGGQKVVEHTADYTLEVTPGIPEGHEIVFEGESDESPDWEPGDIIIRVRTRKDKGGWRRKESSLYWKETIGIDEVCHLVFQALLFAICLIPGSSRFRT